MIPGICFRVLQLPQISQAVTFYYRFLNKTNAHVQCTMAAFRNEEIGSTCVHGDVYF